MYVWERERERERERETEWEEENEICIITFADSYFRNLILATVWRMDSFRDRLNVHRWVLSYFSNAGKRRWELKAGCGGRNGNRGQGEDSITKTWRWDVYRRWGAERRCEWKSLSRVQLFVSMSIASWGPCSGATCRGPAPADPVYSKERWPRRLFIC